MRLTADVLIRAEARLNPAMERELLLRGLQVTAIENFAILQDGFDVIDLSDNEIKKLDNFPRMKRLSCFMLNNNLISRISPSLGSQLPSIRALILTNNRITTLAEVCHIATLQELEHLVLMENPVAYSTHYRLFTIHHIPTLKSLDYRKVSKREREEAKKLFSGDTGKQIMEAVAEEGRAQAEGARAKPSIALTDDQKRQVRAAIEGAKTKDEIDRIEKQLKTGTFAFTISEQSAPSSGADQAIQGAATS